MVKNMDEKRFNELYQRAYDRSYKTFSDFLNMEEQNILNALHLPYTAFGGYETAERILAGFGENIKNSDFPIAYMEICPVSQKFSDTLTHRDFLGSLMGLGIKRELLGDIIVDNNCAYLVCLAHIAQYIMDSLKKIKHTSVKVTKTDTLPTGIIKAPETCEIFAASLRLDVLISSAFKLSRSEAAKLFNSKKIFVNSRLTENSSYQIKENDIISVRGFGRFQYIGQIRKTKKERLVIEIKKY